MSSAETPAGHDLGTPPTLAEYEAAAARLDGVAQRTPLLSSKFLAELAGVPVFLKAENLQRTGSYKLRGAFNRIAQLDEAQRTAGVVAASAGNHAQGVAYAARELGLKATIFMPVGVALPKLQATRRYGAEVVLHGNTFNETLSAATEFAERTGATFIPPYDHRDVIAGQGTLALEILTQCPDVTTVIIPIGGGGLISGVAGALRAKEAELGRRFRIVGVQAENAAAYPPSLQAGKPTQISIKPTIADGIAVSRPGDLNFQMVAELVDEVVTVSDDEIAQALLTLLERTKLIVEPAGAASVAALLSGRVHFEGTTVALLSGGNIDPMMVERVINRGLAAAHRYVKLSIPLPDRPGQLARIAEIIADADANVVEVLHTRHNMDLQISEVELDVHIETRGDEHAELVLSRLIEAGYQPRVG